MGRGGCGFSARGMASGVVRGGGGVGWESWWGGGVWESGWVSEGDVRGSSRKGSGLMGW